MTASIATRSARLAHASPLFALRMIALALLPGLLITAVFVSIAAAITRLGAPASLALLLTWPLAGIPILLVILLLEGRKRNGRLSLAGIVLYHEPLPLRQYLWLVPVLFVWVAITSTLSVPVADGVRRAAFAWWPERLVLSTFAQNLNLYSPAVLWTVVSLSFILNIAVPVVEELYFRGFLLAEMELWDKWGPLVNVVLFSLYHFWLPWEIPTRIVTLLPVIYAVRWKRNIYLSILVHCLLNTIGSLGLLVLVLTRR